MRLSVAIPNGLVDVSNGRFLGKTDLGDGYTRWDWQIHYPINNYSVSLNIGDYVHFADSVNGQTLDYYVLPADLEKAKQQFPQAKGMMQAFEKYIGKYPFRKDGYKLVEVPYSGMEHQSAVTYGNHFANGYLERDWTGVGISTKFDFIIVHESAHEWFGNAITAADVSDEWIHEAWATYAEAIYVEHMWGKDEGIRYLGGYVPKVQNRVPIVAPRGVNKVPPQDMYFKGALFINTLRSIVDDDRRWWKLIREYYNEFKYRDILTEDVVAFFNTKTGKRPHAGVQPVPAPHGSAGARVDVRRGIGLLSLEGGRTGLHDAGEGRPEGALADDPADPGVAIDEDRHREGRLRGRDGALLHKGHALRGSCPLQTADCRLQIDGLSIADCGLGNPVGNPAIRQSAICNLICSLHLRLHSFSESHHEESDHRGLPAPRDGLGRPVHPRVPAGPPYALRGVGQGQNRHRPAAGGGHREQGAVHPCPW